MNTQPSGGEFIKVLPIDVTKEGTRVKYTFPTEVVSRPDIEIHQVRNQAFEILFTKEQKKILLSISLIFSSFPLSFYEYFEGAAGTLIVGLFYGVTKIKSLEKISERVLEIIKATGNTFVSREEIRQRCLEILKNK